MHSQDSQIRKQFNVIDYQEGHYKTTGTHAGIMKNPIWNIIDSDGTEKLIMYCEIDTICKLCPEAYQNIRKFEEEKKYKCTWFKSSQGYIQTHVVLFENKKTALYMHQIIMNCYGNGKGTMNVSIDHIDNDPFNNTLVNLRLATREQQEMNKTCSVVPASILDTITAEERDEQDIKLKRKRQENACDLPDGITQDMMPKYVTYSKRLLKEGYSSGFVVEGHPNMNGDKWRGTTNMKIPILDKLNEAIDILKNIEKSIPNVKPERKLPLSVSIIFWRDKPHLSFDKRTDNESFNKKMVLPENYDIDEQLVKFNKTIVEKYGPTMALPDIKIVHDIADDKYKFPDNVYLQPIAGIPTLVYQKSENKKRLNVKHKLPQNYDLRTELIHFNELVVEKYGEPYSFIENINLEDNINLKNNINMDVNDNLSSILPMEVNEPILKSDYLEVNEIEKLKLENQNLKNKIENLEQINKELKYKLNNMQLRTTNFNTPLATLGPRLQKINPETLQLVKVYESVTECMNENSSIKRPSINKAVLENTIYCGFRWIFVDRELDANVVGHIEPTIEVREQNIGYIAKLNSDKTEIVNIYLDRKTASQSNGHQSASSLDVPVKNFTISNGHYYMLYENCSDELKDNFIQKNNGEPILYKNGVGQYDDKMNLLEEFICKYDVIRKLHMSDRTLAKALDKDLMYNNRYYKSIGSKLKCF
jgi:hypothetical protein